MKKNPLDLDTRIEGRYRPSAFEKQIYDFWQDKNYFHPQVDHSKKPFSMVIPPPNVTGYLHVGHALNNTLQDVVIRYMRMKGLNTAWIPGTDHAGIATQNVVERSLEKTGADRHQLGRERFVEEVWKWKEKYGSRIISQLKALGCSCDWDRQRFTFDDDYVDAVTTEFVTLYEQGLIYRGDYIINWCTRCSTAISDIEVEHDQREGRLWDIKYPLTDSRTGRPSGKEYVIVSTTRPETMLGDTAVAVNPSDHRYRKLAGRSVFLPLMGRKIPIIEDDYVDMEFGSGAVKVTPAHDPNDFEMGKRHGLEEINIMEEDGTLNSNAGEYEGLDRYDARKKVLQDLKSGGYLLGTSDHVSSVGICSRCGTTVEPRISTQWFVSMKGLAGPAIEAVKDGRVELIPGKWKKIYYEWMENIRDWCISRQLWWGHRIPVWYCDCGEMIVAKKPPRKCPACGGSGLVQDEDVLDTWFSSCLWPFATLGWPDETEDLKYFFPTDVLITAHDIIFFWVARMIMMALHFRDDIPFGRVFINPLVNDASGQKMSKSRGNVVDPMTIIDKYGADVLRFTLTSLTTPGRNLLLGDEKIEGIRNFANKIWNAARFVISSVADAGDDIPESPPSGPDRMELNTWDRWIVSRLAATIREAERDLESFNFSQASRALYDFFWSEFCDWYLEASKTRLYSPLDDTDLAACRYVLWYVMERYLRALHPFMPHLTERIWQEIPHRGESIMIADFPEAAEADIDLQAEKDIRPVFDVVAEVRKIRSELKINPGAKVAICLDTADDRILEQIEKNRRFVYELAGVEDLQFRGAEGEKGYIKTVISGIGIYIYILEAVDIELEINRIRDELEKNSLQLEKSRKKLDNPDFMKKAPEKIISKEKKRLEEARQARDVLKEQLDRMKDIKK